MARFESKVEQGSGGNSSITASSGALRRPNTPHESWRSPPIGPQFLLGRGLTAETRCRGASSPLANSASKVNKVPLSRMWPTCDQNAKVCGSGLGPSSPLPAGGVSGAEGAEGRDVAQHPSIAAVTVVTVVSPIVAWSWLSVTACFDVEAFFALAKRKCWVRQRIVRRTDATAPKMHRFDCPLQAAQRRQREAERGVKGARGTVELGETGCQPSIFPSLTQLPVHLQRPTSNSPRKQLTQD